MPSARDPFERFARALHRRYVLLRVLERTGLGVLAGCAVALALLPVLLWRGQPAWAPVGWCLAGGGAAGLLWGIRTRPTLLAAVAEADRQLHLAELLGTALAVRRQPVDPWAANVLAAADRRCAALSPSAVLLNHLGARAWGGIGLAAALVLTLASLSTAPTGSRAAVASRDPTPAASSTEPIPEDRPLIADAPAPVRPRDAGAATDQQGPDRPGSEVQEETEGPEQGGEADPSEAAADPAATGSGGAPGDGSAGAGRTDPLPRRPTTPPDAATATEAGDDGTEDGAAKPGTGRPSADTSPPGDAAGGTSASGLGAGPPPPPWRSEGWAADAERAGRALDAGRVPDAYRDLVRGYFEPDRP